MAINNFNVGVGTTSQLTRYRYVATGGETSISGADADGKTLSYTVGLEQVFLNGVNLVRGQDYTATNGTSIGNLTALVASDSLEVFAYVPFNIANAVTASTVDAKGDLLVGTAADTVGRLAVGTNGQLLSAASGETSGLKWLNGGLTLVKTESFSAVATVNVNDVFSSTYRNYKILIDYVPATTSGIVSLRMRTSSDDSTSNYQRIQIYPGASSPAQVRNNNQTDWACLGNVASDYYSLSIDMFTPFESLSTQWSGLLVYRGYSSTSNEIIMMHGGHSTTTSFTGFSILSSGSNLTGTVQIFGYNK